MCSYFSKICLNTEPFLHVTHFYACLAFNCLFLKGKVKRWKNVLLHRTYRVAKFKSRCNEIKMKSSQASSWYSTVIRLKERAYGIAATVHRTTHIHITAFSSTTKYETHWKIPNVICLWPTSDTCTVSSKCFDKCKLHKSKYFRDYCNLLIIKKSDFKAWSLDTRTIWPIHTGCLYRLYNPLTQQKWQKHSQAGPSQQRSLNWWHNRRPSCVWILASC